MIDVSPEHTSMYVYFDLIIMYDTPEAKDDHLTSICPLIASVRYSFRAIKFFPMHWVEMKAKLNASIKHIYVYIHFSLIIMSE